MSKLLKIIIPVVVIIGGLGVLAWLLQDSNATVLNPQGTIANQQRDLIIFTLALSAIVVIPVFVLTFVIAWRFRAGNHKAKYRPNWESNRVLESIWWGIPIVIIAILAVVTWRTSHSLDPYKPLDSNTKPLEVQVVALQWKWLFIYPEQHIATANMLKFPEKTPLNFTITADAPMNSFWIPSLGGQVYAMSGMSTQLHLMADSTGTYYGRSANISGEGFSDMNFAATSLTRADFDKWVQGVQQSADDLDMAAYDKLAKPGTMEKPMAYALAKQDLYDTIVMKYMSHGAPHHDETAPVAEKHSHDMTHMPAMEGME